MSENPFKGLQSYGPDDSDKLFGRERDLILMKDRIFSARTTLLFAGSGVGKTSFLNAKVIPELQEQYRAFYHSRWAGPLKPLEAVKTTLAEGIPNAEKTERLIDCFEEFVYKPPPEEDDADPEQAGEGVPADQQCLLVFDQFEEIFQYHAYEDYFKRFLDEVCEIVRRDDCRVHLVISMREEYLGELSVFENLIPDLFNNYYRLRYPNKRDAAQIIEGTCKPTKVDRDNLKELIRDLSKIEKGVASAAERSTHDGKAVDRVVERSFIIPPYLQIVCHRKWEEQAAIAGTNGNENGFVFLESYKPNQAQTMLRDFCQEKLSALTFMEQNVAERSFDFLVTKQGAKMAYEFTSLVEHMRLRFFKAKLKSALNKLSAPETRILRKSHGPDGSVWFELYHDIYGKILDTWRASFRARKHRLIFLFGILSLIALLILIPISWYWGIQPYRLKNVIRNAHLEKPEVYPNALGAYNNLAGTFGYASTADTLWAEAWERRARYAESRNERDEAIISWLNALKIKPASPRADVWRQKAGNLIGDDYEIVSHRWYHDNGVESAIFSGDGKLVVTQTDDQRLWVWDVKSGALVGKHADPQSSVPAEPLPTATPAAGAVNTSKQTKPTEKSNERLTPKSHTVHDVAVNEQLGWMVAITFDEIDFTSKYKSLPVSILSKNDELLSSGIEVEGKRSDYGYFSKTVAVSSDGKYVATTGRGQATRVWKIENGKAIATQGFKSNGFIDEIAFSSDGKSLLMGNDKSQLLMWDVASEQLRYPPLSFRLRQNFIFSSDGDSFAVTYTLPKERAAAEVRNTVTGERVGKPVTTNVSMLRYRTLALAADDTILLYAGEESVLTATPSSTEFQQAARINGDQNSLMGFSPDLDVGLTYRENEARVHKIELQTVRYPMLDPGDEIENYVLSKDGERITTLISKPDSTTKPVSQWILPDDAIRYSLQVWNAETLAPIGKRLDNVIVFSDDGEYAATLDPKKTSGDSRRGKKTDSNETVPVHIINVRTGSEVVTVQYPDRNLFGRLVFSPTGRFFATYRSSWDDYRYVRYRLPQAGAYLYLWDRNDPTRPVPWNGNLGGSSQFTCAFSPDERFFAASGSSITVWDLGTMEQLSLTKNLGQAGALAFNKHGQLAAGAAKKLRIWNLSTRQPITELDALARVTAVALGSDGSTLLVGDETGSSSLWRFSLNGQIVKVGETRHREMPGSVDFSADERFGIISSGDWLHTTNHDNHSYVMSYFLGSPWTRECSSMDTDGSQFRCLFMLPDGQLKTKVIKNGEIQDNERIAGDAGTLFETWSRRLSLRIDPLGRIVPAESAAVFSDAKNSEAAASPTSSP